MFGFSVIRVQNFAPWTSFKPTRPFPGLAQLTVPFIIHFLNNNLICDIFVLHFKYDKEVFERFMYLCNIVHNIYQICFISRSGIT
jgi:hypothetical protein